MKNDRIIMLEAGVYSAFVLIEDGTWTQPSFSIARLRPKREVENKLMEWKGGFLVYGLQSDDDAPKDEVTPLFDLPTLVVFRKFKADLDLVSVGIIALFPEIDAGMGFCQAYQHVGQHGPAVYSECIRITVPAMPDEYAELKEELEKIGYDLKVRTRWQKRKAKQTS